MKKGFTVALMALACASLSLNAHALAPIISDVPDIIIGNANDSTASFTFNDAFNVVDYAVDPDGSKQPSELKWAFWDSTSRYTFNGVTSLAAAADAADPAKVAAQSFSTQVLGGEIDADSSALTATIRDNIYSPLGGANVTDPTPVSAVVSFFASDDEDVSDGFPVMISSKPGEKSRFDGKASYDLSTEDGYNQFTFIDAGAAYGLPGATVARTADGACITIPVGNWTEGKIFPTNPSFTLANNKVYAIRMSVSTSQNDVMQAPVWSVVVANYPADSDLHPNQNGGSGYGDGRYFFGNEYFFIPLEGGANSAANQGGAFGRSDFEVYFLPPQISVPGWVNSAFTAAHVDSTSAQVFFRSYGDDTGTPILAGRNGNLCLKTFSIDTIDYASMAKSAVYNPGTMTAANTTQWLTLGTGGVYEADGLMVDPVTQADQASNFLFERINAGQVTDPSYLDPNLIPVEWTDDTLYLLTVTAKAPSAADAGSPLDQIMFGMQAFTNEVNAMAYFTGADFADVAEGNHCSMPTTTPTDYQILYYTHSKCATPGLDGYKIMPFLQPFSGDTMSFQGQTANTGKTVFQSFKVEKITLP